MRVGIYVRVSTEKQKKRGISLHNQEEKGIEFCTNQGYDYEIFRDEGISGTLPFTERPGLNKLIDKIFNKEIGGIYVLHWDRLSRDETDGFAVKEILRREDIKLFTDGGELDLDDEGQNLLTGVNILVSTYEARRISTRIRQNLEKSVRDGKAGGGPLQPYGFKKDNNKKLVIDEYESNIIRKIFELAIEGKGTKKIADYLNETKIPTKRMRTLKGEMKVRGETKSIFKWRDSVVYNILKNTLYKGQRRYKGKIYEVPEIIDPIVFDYTQQVLSKRKNFKDTTNKYSYLLKGLLFCGKCGSRFYGRKREDLSDNQYICSSQRYRSNFCGTRGINIDRLENYIWDSIIDLPIQIEKIVFTDNHRTESQLLEKIKVGKSLLTNIEGKINNLLRLYENDQMSLDLIRKRIDSLSERREKLIGDISHLNKELSYYANKEEIVDYVKNVIRLDETSNYSFDERRRVVQSLIEGIVIKFNEEANIHFIAIEFKLGKLTKNLVGKTIDIKYKKSGWRLDEESIDTMFHFTKITPSLESYPLVKMDSYDLFWFLRDKKNEDRNKLTP